MTKAQERRRERWAQALESGAYTQITGKLRSVEGYCALGVGCDLYVKAHHGGLDWQQVDPFNWGLGRGVGIMPAEVARWYGLNGYMMSAISSLNDVGTPFAAIAARVRQ